MKGVQQRRPRQPEGEILADLNIAPEGNDGEARLRSPDPKICVPDYPIENLFP
jgi:hypothetical protein